MPKEENKISDDLSNRIKTKLNSIKEDGEAFSGDLEEDPEKLMKDAPLQSIALSLYHIERTLKGMLYIQNVNADESLNYNREHFFAILGGPDPELLQKEEINRLRKLDGLKPIPDDE